MTATYLRQATQADLPSITSIIHDAKGFLKQQGIDQWQDGYPADDDLKNDIDEGITYVLVVDGTVAGTAALHQGIDVNYLTIDDGEWQTGTLARYTAIHRIAVSSHFRGQHLANRLMSGLITISSILGYRDVRIDTHPDNQAMQHVIKTSGFNYRGKVYMHDSKALRYAYELVIL
ncbi:GCN5 family acetyltransferase [Secundilactobacillus paracollinoides]|uniref:GCN5 family acetyltransferase n=1 Tax=Secundilactobacillus paracollinoides TaxID=240427 RepID=A0A1B2IX74_9LACO|nr:GNAT family N-acetyltransferase [Secundilactobacillus paracollinoides]ANZ65156.1 GCN5 family acetyltransferase [Secundilactobacillus paracollinoides]ANZ66629.1 GCN5 family acetyltransferase [Secundilactobacillus paracollinoides]KRL79191.1 N-acetyltransferase GCN5 [Secundilactobacillus paracollinoides DSM 15502 = JCM 11969]